MSENLSILPTVRRVVTARCALDLAREMSIIIFTLH